MTAASPLLLSLRACIVLCEKKSSRPRFTALSFKITIANHGLRFRTSNLIVDPKCSHDTSHPNTLDQRAKSPVISRCSGFFMTENFQSIPWLNGNATEVRTGFEPLFFHIQAEFQWQRPFSEGCRGEIPEKTKKNLSQSYGRWIVGFHEPMTSAFFALKKGAADWRYDIERRTHTAEGKISA